MPKFSSDTASWLYSQFASQISPTPGKKDYLRQLVLHVSEACNLGCKYCFADRGHYGKSEAQLMSAQTAIEALKTAIRQYKTIEKIKFFGGEPLLNLQTLTQVTDYLGDYRQKNPSFKKPGLSLITNLTIAESGALKWIKKEKVRITGSIDGPEEFHDQFRIYPGGAGSFSTVDQNIKKMRDHCGEPSALECVYTPQHFAKGLTMVELHQWLKERYGVEEIIIHPLALLGETEHMVNSSQWKEYTSSLFELSLSYGRYLVSQKSNNTHYAARFIRDTFYTTQSNRHCDLGVNNLTVSASGDLYPCYLYMGDARNAMGAVKEMNTGETFLEKQNLFYSSSKDKISECRSCDIVKVCHSCPGEMDFLTGSPKAPYRHACDYLIGIMEGSLLYLNEMRTSDEEWSLFLSNL